MLISAAVALAVVADDMQEAGWSAKGRKWSPITGTVEQGVETCAKRVFSKCVPIAQAPQAAEGVEPQLIVLTGS